MGDKQSLLVAIGLATVGCLGLSVSTGIGWIGVFALVFGLAYGYYNAVYAAVAMRLSNARIAASMFAIFMMFINLGTVGGQVIGGQLTEGFGFHHHGDHFWSGESGKCSAVVRFVHQGKQELAASALIKLV